ncbi:MAG: hypothetical protein Tp138OMZ00d2C19078241_5 [Prokaryotic dsDNA virus sp.]|jgi:hypothetical protein|nr:MAG: hypothetical protein Tp138OMZ00d2C19078241_5 [Prokaryotic dsDNA virus sp.]|tara:strand:- start:24945 stop:26552 length:1608 start_codon:yes stop_codon:yes gene_type:complete
MAGEGTIYYDVDVNTSEAIDAFRNLKAQNLQVQKTFSGTDQAAKKTGANLGGMGRKAGAAGIQIQQFVGQVQGGQSALVALSQQAADLGIVLGFPLVGAVAGITAAIAGPFITSLFDAEDATDRVKEAIQELRDELTKPTEAQTIKELEKETSALNKALKDLRSPVRSVRDDARDAIEDITGAEIGFLSGTRDAVDAARTRIQQNGRLIAQQTAAMRERIAKDLETPIPEGQDFALDDYFKEQERRRQAELESRARYAAGVIAQQQVQFQDEQTLANEQLQARLEAIEIARQQEIDIGQSYDQAEIEAKALHAQKLAEIDKKRTDDEKAQAAARLAQKQAEINAYGQFFGQLSNLMAAAGKEQTALAKAIFLANQAIAVANIIVDAHRNSEAAGGTATPLGNTILTLGYISAGIAGGIAVGETFAGRQTGGSVDPNSAYRVNETGTEGYKFSTGGREYIQMLGGRGEVIPANEMQNMGGGVTINVNNAPGVGATANASPDGKYITIDTFRTDMAEGGPMSRAMKGAYPNLTRKTR